MKFWTYLRSKRALSLAFVSVTALAAVAAGACSGSSDAAAPYGGAVSTPVSTISSVTAYPVSSPAAGSAATPGSRMAAGTASPLAVAVTQGDVGAFLTGPSGKTLYVFTRDAKNTSNCDAACLATWPPLLAKDGQTIQGGNGATGAFGRISSASGTQVTYNGAPLYYFADDARPGDTRGQGFSGVWFVARPDTASTAEVNVSGTGTAARLVGPNGLTLYFFAKDTAGMSSCAGQCLENWPALTVPADLRPIGAGVTGAVAFLTRADNSAHQITYNGRPLYFFAGDSLPGDTRGDGIGGVWTIARP